MGMSTHVIGFRPPDETWQRMKAIWDACKAAGVGIPAEVEDFFGGGAPDPAGVEVELPTQAWKDDYNEGYEVELAHVPAGVTRIRFYNSW